MFMGSRSKVFTEVDDVDSVNIARGNDEFQSNIKKEFSMGEKKLKKAVAGDILKIVKKEESIGNAKASIDKNGGESLLELLNASVHKNGTKTFAAWYDAKGKVGKSYSFQELWDEAGYIAHYLRIGKDVAKGERVLLCYSPGLDFFASFFACLRAGIVAVPTYPPDPRKLEVGLKKMEMVHRDCDAKLVLADANVVKLMALWKLKNKLSRKNFKPEVEVHPKVPKKSNAPTFEDNIISDEDLAFLQYTSGSTGDPKGVMITYGAMRANCMSSVKALGGHAKGVGASEENIVGLSWLPQYHDMGLVFATVAPFVGGWRCNMISPIDFLFNPLLWIELMSKLKVHWSIAPNFAYQLTARKFLERQSKNPSYGNRIDLSSIIQLGSASEHIQVDTKQMFDGVFSKFGLRESWFCAGYGLAESVACVSTLHSLKISSDRRLVAVAKRGYLHDGQVMKIVCPDSQVWLPDGETGEIWISGPSVAKGYWGNQELSKKTFEAKLLSDKEDVTYLRTGDIGFFEDDYLYICGRLKDLIIHNGRNFYAHDVEMAVQNASKEAVRPGCVAAFSSDDEDKGELEIVFEIRKEYEKEAKLILKAIHDSVVKNVELFPTRIVAIKEKKIMKTTSGKIQRRKNRAALHKGDFTKYIILDSNTSQNYSSPFDSAAKSSLSDGCKTITDLDAKCSSIMSGLQPKLSQYEVAAEVERAIKTTLKSDEDIDHSLSLLDTGLTSMAISELMSVIESRFDVQLSSTDLFNYPTIQSLANHIYESVTTKCESVSSDSKPIVFKDHSDSPKKSIAITGVSCRFPGGVTCLNSFWDLICGEHSTSTGIPFDRWDQYSILNELNLSNDEMQCASHGSFVRDILHFDPAVFGISLVEAKAMDPQMRMLLECAYLALKDAGYDHSSLRGSNCGVFVAVGAGHLKAGDSKSFSVYDLTAGSASMAAGRISFAFDLKGPNASYDTACSSSLVALHSAVCSIERKECSIALVLGANQLFESAEFMAFAKAGMLSPTGMCHTWDESADGYLRGEGCGAIVLESVEDGFDKHVYAEILGTSFLSDGKSASITAPNGLAQQQLINETLAVSGLNPDDIDFIEAHGTGTSLGDPVEVEALARVFGESKCPESQLLVGSVKSNIGHLEYAAGMAGIIKTILVLMFESVPSNIGLKRLNPHIVEAVENHDFNVKFPTKQTPLRSCSIKPDSEPLVAGVSSFGYSGTISHTILCQPRVHDQRKLAPSKLSGVMFLFTGQGSQYPGMGMELYHGDADFRKAMDKCDSIFKKEKGLSLVNLIESSTKENFSNTRVSQVALVAVEWSLSEMWKANGIIPSIVLGHSIGEITAACVAGAFSIETALCMAIKRGEVMGNLDSNSAIMVAVRCSAEDARTAIDECLNDAEKLQVGVASENGPSSIVLSGRDAVVEKVCTNLDKKNVKLDISHAFHSPLMQPATGPFRNFLSSLGGLDHPLTTALASTVSGKVISVGSTIQSRVWVDQMTSTVKFLDAFRSAKSVCNPAVVIEQGPQPVVSKMAKTLLKSDIDISVSSWIASLDKDKAVSFDENLKCARQTLKISLDLNSIFPNRDELLWTRSYRSHPLLQKKLDIGTRGAEFHTFFHHELIRFYESHTVCGCNLFPASGYVEMAIAGLMFSGSKIQGGAVELVEASFLQSFVLDAGCNLVSEHFARGGVTFRRDLTESAVEMPLAKIEKVNILKSVDEENIESFSRDLEDLKSKHTVQSYCKKLGRSGYPGAPFQNIKSAWLSKDGTSVLGLIGLSRKTHVHDAHYIVHPAVLDGAFKMIGFTADAKKSGLAQVHSWIPAGFSRLQMHRGHAEFHKKKDLWALLELTDCNPTMKSSNIQIFDNKGVIITLEGVIFRQVNEELLDPSSALSSCCTPKFDNQFFVMGEHIITEDDSLAKIRDYISFHLKKYLNDNPSFLSSHPWLENVLVHAKRDSPSKAPNFDGDLYESSLMYRIAVDLYSDLPKLLENPLCQLTLHPEHDSLYENGASASSAHDLALLLGLVRKEWNGVRLRVFEVGTGSGGLTRRAFPLLEDALESYVCSDIFDIRLGTLQDHPLISKVKYDVNTCISSEKKFHLILAANSIHIARDVRDALQRLCDKLEEGGMLFLEEAISRDSLYIHGLDEFVWNTASEKRSFGIWMAWSEWLDAIASVSGLELLVWFRSSAFVSMVLRKVTKEIAVSNYMLTDDLQVANENLGNGMGVVYCGPDADDVVKSLTATKGRHINIKSLALREGEDDVDFDVNSLMLKYNALNEGVLGSVVSIPSEIGKDLSNDWCKTNPENDASSIRNPQISQSPVESAIQLSGTQRNTIAEFDSIINSFFGTNEVDYTSSWEDIGMDSLMAFEFRDAIRESFSIALEPNWLATFKSPAELKEFIFGRQCQDIHLESKVLALSEMQCLNISWTTWAILQCVGSVVLLVLLSLCFIFAFYLGMALNGAFSFAAVTWIVVPLTVPAWMIMFSTFVLALKWCIVWKYREGTVEVQSLQYLRWWVVDRSLDVWEFWIGRYIVGTPLINFFYFLLGAKLDLSVRMDAFIREFDLVTIGKESTIKSKISCRKFLWRERSPASILFRNVVIAESCTIKGMVSPGASIGEGALVDELAFVEECAILPSKTFATSNPAIIARDVVPQPSKPHCWWKVGALKCLWLVFEMYHFFAVVASGDMLWTRHFSSDWRYDQIMKWLLIFLWFSLVSVVSSILIKWILIGKRRPGPRDTSLLRSVADDSADFHFLNLNHFLFGMCFNSQLWNVVLMLHGMDVDLVSKLFLDNFSPSNLDLIRIRKSLLSAVYFDTSNHENHEQIQISGSSIGHSCKISSKSSIVNTVIPPLTKVCSKQIIGAETLDQRNTISDITVCQLICDEIFSFLFFALNIAVVFGSVVPSFEMWVFLSPRSILSATITIGLCFFLQMFSFAALLSLYSWAALMNAEKREEVYSKVLYKNYQCANYMFHCYTLVSVLQGSPLYNLFMGFLGSKFEGRAVLFPHIMYDHSLLKFADRSFVDDALIIGHYSVYNKLRVGPCAVSGVVQRGTFAANAALPRWESGPYRAYVGTFNYPKKETFPRSNSSNIQVAFGNENSVAEKDHITIEEHLCV